MIRQTCSIVITGILKYVLFGTLLSTKCFNLVKSVPNCSLSVSLKISETEEKYPFHLAAIPADFVYRLLL